MKKVLVFGITENPGGVESVIMNYYRNIDKNNVQFDFLCNTDKVAYEDEINLLGGKIYRITQRRENARKFHNDMNDFFKKHAKEYSTIWVNVCSLANIDYLKYAKKYGIKYRVIHSHNSQNMDSFIRGVLHKVNKHRIKKYATDFWSCGEEAGKWFYTKKITASDKYMLVNNAINLKEYAYDEKVREKYRKEFKIDDDSVVIGHVGRFHFQKNHDFLIDIFYEYHKLNNKSYLLLIGDGEDKQKIKEKVESLNISNNVKFLGLRKDVKELLNAMDIFLFPSLFEGLPVALIEAQANGLPVYASKDTISDKSKMSDNFNFISLNKSGKEWANIMYNNKNNRKDNKQSIAENGFDIEQECEKIENYFKR